MANKREGDFIINNYDKDSGEPFNSKIIANFPDGEIITDEWVDNNVILKNKSSNGGGYSVRSFGAGSERVLNVDSMLGLRSLSKTNIILLKLGQYKYVQLNGYYTKNDTPSPINYYISSTLDSDDAGSVIQTGPLKLEHKFVESISTAYFGVLNRSNLSPTENSKRIQNCFDASLKYQVKKVTIEGDHEIDGSVSALIYSNSNSELYFNGELKLGDNKGRLSGTMIIAYNANNITVFNQKLDGNRNNNPISDSVGTQFNFTTYGDLNVIFNGGYSKNAALNHTQSTSENVTFDNMDFDMSGEHGLYLTLASGQPIQRVRVSNCRISNWALTLRGVGVSIRDYRYGLIDNCDFISGNIPSPEGRGCISSITEYDSVLLPGEDLKHLVLNCRLYHGVDMLYTINASVENEGRGLFVEGGYIEGAILDGVNVHKCHLKNTVPTSVYRQLPKTITNCLIEDWNSVSPNVDKNFSITDSEFKRVNYPINSSASSLINIIQGTLDNGSIEISRNIFDGYDIPASLGIIRSKSTVRTLASSNRFRNCGTSTFVRTQDRDVIIGNIDEDNSGVKLNLTVQPSFVSGNNFLKEYGTTAERPDPASTVPIGYIFYDTEFDKPMRWNGSAWVDYIITSSETKNGLIRIATTAEINGETNDSRAVTPLKLGNKLKRGPLTTPAPTRIAEEPTKAQVDVIVDRLNEISNQLSTLIFR